MKRFISGFVICVFFTVAVYPQNTFDSMQATSIYDFLDELANQQIISLVSVVKPYSRSYIEKKLYEAHSQKEHLNPRQAKELEFYLKDYGIYEKLPASVLYDLLEKRDKVGFSLNPSSFNYKDSAFLFSIRPVLGLHYFTNSNGYTYHRYNGLEAFAEINKNLSVYASLVDNNEDQILAKESFLTQRQGANYKRNVNNTGRNDFSEMRGGILYDFGYGSIGLVKDHVVWGNNYHGANILSGRTPSFAHIRLHLSPADWLHFNYIHGWLVSEVVDSNRSYFDSQLVYREVFHDKYLAANMFTVTPFKNFDFSFGNSIIYSDIGVQPGYLIPLLFYKSVDHTLNSTSNHSGQNAQMFFDVSSRQIPFTHLYASLFVDEIRLSTMFDEETQRNQLSFKGGLRVSNLIPNVFVIGEYTRNNPWVYRHYISTTTFKSNTYNLGHYLRDNAEEYYIAVGYRPLRGLQVMASYLYARKGEEHPFIRSGSCTGTPFMEDVHWKNEAYSVKVHYDVFNRFRLFADFTYSEIFDTTENYFTPDFFKGQQRTFSFGFNMGF